MAELSSAEAEKNAARMVCALMAASVRTAPKTKGIDALKTKILEGSDLESLAKAMEQKAEKSTRFPSAFSRDAANLRKSACVLLVGVSGDNKGLDCGACGYTKCRGLQRRRQRGVREGRDFTGPNCLFQGIDLGIALSSAVKLASDLNVDNRMMYTVGAAAKAIKLLDSDIIIGIPLSVSGKSPYFDRKERKK